MSKVSVRRVCFTLNNYTEEDLRFIQKHLTGVSKYLIVGKEVGETGTPHLQGFINLKKKTHFNSVKKLLPRAHIDKAKGTDQHNKDYCSKQEVALEHGEIQGQGKRNDLASALATVRANGGDIKALEDSHAVVYAKYKRGILACIDDFGWKKERDWKTEVHVLWGIPGCGKSRYAREQAPEAYYKPRGEWWDGYTGQEDVIVDDFYGWLQFDELLRICDRYPHRVPVKGSFVQFTAKRIYITSNVPVPEWYPSRGSDLPALYRRLTTYVVWCDVKKEFQSVAIQINY
ncbi:replication-associated protein [Anguilla anguilla circovirus]|nr:replication-associated protein [Anguilla anguilla circovirus]